MACFIFLVFLVIFLIFKKNITLSFEKATLQKNFVIVEEELDGINIDGIGNLKDSPRFASSDEECENQCENRSRQCAIMVDNLLEILTKRRMRFTIVYINFHYVTNAVGETIFSVTM